MPTIQEDIEAARTKLATAADKLHAIVNGPATGGGSTVETDSGTVKSVAKAIAEIGDTSNQATKTLDNVTDGDFAAKAAAAGVDGTGDMLAENNLSDLTDDAAARSNLGLGSAALLTAGTSAGNVVALDGSARLPAIDGSQLIGVASAELKDWAVEALMRLDGLENTLGAASYGSAVIDSFGDETAIDAGASSGFVYSAADGGYINAGDGSNVAAGSSVSTSIGNYAGTPGSLVDSNPATAWQGNLSVAGFTAGKYVQFDLGTARFLTKLRNYIVPSQDNFALTTVKGSLTGAFAGEEFDMGSGTFVNPGSAAYQDLSLAGKARYVRMVSANGTLTGSFNGNNPVMYEVLILQAAPAVAVLQSDSGVITAASAPSSLRILVDVLAIDACLLAGTPGLSLFASRDGGSTFTAVTLDDTTALAAGERRLVKGTVDVSGQPTGTDIVLKLTATADGLLQPLGWSVQADVDLEV